MLCSKMRRCGMLQRNPRENLTQTPQWPGESVCVCVCAGQGHDAWPEPERMSRNYPGGRKLGGYRKDLVLGLK